LQLFTISIKLKKMKII